MSLPPEPPLFQPFLHPAAPLIPHPEAGGNNTGNWAGQCAPNNMQYQHYANNIHEDYNRKSMHPNHNHFVGHANDNRMHRGRDRPDAVAPLERLGTYPQDMSEPQIPHQNHPNNQSSLSTRHVLDLLIKELMKSEGSCGGNDPQIPVDMHHSEPVSNLPSSYLPPSLPPTLAPPHKFTDDLHVHQPPHHQHGHANPPMGMSFRGTVPDHIIPGRPPPSNFQCCLMHNMQHPHEDPHLKMDHNFHSGKDAEADEYVLIDSGNVSNDTCDEKDDSKLDTGNCSDVEPSGKSWIWFKYSQDQLRHILKTHGVATWGKKSILVKRLLDNGVPEPSGLEPPKRVFVHHFDEECRHGRKRTRKGKYDDANDDASSIGAGEADNDPVPALNMGNAKPGKVFPSKEDALKEDVPAGVRYHYAGANSERAIPIWRVSWYDESRKKTVTRGFSCSKYGYERAKQLAIKFKHQTNIDPQACSSIESIQSKGYDGTTDHRMGHDAGNHHPHGDCDMHRANNLLMMDRMMGSVPDYDRMNVGHMFADVETPGHTVDDDHLASMATTAGQESADEDSAVLKDEHHPHMLQMRCTPDVTHPSPHFLYTQPVIDYTRANHDCISPMRNTRVIQMPVDDSAARRDGGMDGRLARPVDPMGNCVRRLPDTHCASVVIPELEC